MESMHTPIVERMIKVKIEILTIKLAGAKIYFHGGKATIVLVNFGEDAIEEAEILGNNNLVAKKDTEHFGSAWRRMWFQHATIFPTTRTTHGLLTLTG